MFFLSDGKAAARRGASPVAQEFAPGNVAKFNGGLIHASVPKRWCTSLAKLQVEQP